jgi:hypothetical protein
MPFEKGNKYGKGRPPRGESLKELLTQVGVTRKQDLVKKAYEYAIAGSFQWADWIARHSGEGAALKMEMESSSGWQLMMSSIRDQLMGQAVDGDYVVLDGDEQVIQPALPPPTDDYTVSKDD